MSDIPWEVLSTVIDTGDEEQKIELKERIDCSSRPGRAVFAKDAAAIANTGGGVGYIVVGVVDARHRTPDAAWMPGFQVPDPDEFHRQMGEAIERFIEPPFEVWYRQASYPGTGVGLGVVVIPVSQRRPHVVRNDEADLYVGQIFVRRGTRVAVASRQDVVEMCGDYWLPSVEDQKRTLLEVYRETDRDALDFKHIAESACRRLYHALPTKTRSKVVKEILRTFQREDLAQEWFREG